MAKIDKVQEISIARLNPYSKNAKKHSNEQVDKIAKSITEFGFLNPVLIDEEKNIIAGHGRVMAAAKIGMDKVPCLSVEGLTPEQYKAYVLADNKLTELGEWDMTLVTTELLDLKENGFDISLTGFSIDDITFDDDEFLEVPEEEDEEPTEEIVPRIHRGEVWKLGEHRLMCGDSTSAKDVEKLMNGESADLCVTDPPYNVAYQGGTKDKLTIENDNMSEEDFLEFLEKVFANMRDALKEGGAFYVWHASSSQKQFMDALINNGLDIRQMIIWVKSSLVLGRQDYQWKHEPCLYGWKDGASHYFIDVRSLTTVIEKEIDEMNREELVDALRELISQVSTISYYDKPNKSELHPTMKPVGLIERQVRNSSKGGEIVLDLFGGSGTTLIACENLERKCRMMEYDERYAETIIRRWEEQTGKVAIKDE